MFSDRRVVPALVVLASVPTLSSLACRSPAGTLPPVARPEVVDLVAVLDRYDTSTSPREAWSLKTETHAVYRLSLRQTDTVLFGGVRLDSLQHLVTTPTGTRVHPIDGSPGGPILGYTFIRRGSGPYELDSVPTSARPRGLNETQILEIPNLVVVPPPTACRAGGTWADSAALPPVPVAGASPSTIWWRASFRVDSITAVGS